MCGVIVVDAESIGLLVSDVMPICMIIALDIIMTLRYSINCSIFADPPWYLLFWEKPLVNTMAPGSTPHHIFSHTLFTSLHFPPSDLTLQTILKGFTTPSKRWVQACLCLRRYSGLDETLLLDRYLGSQTEGNTYCSCAASPFPLQGKNQRKPSLCQRVNFWRCCLWDSRRISGAVVGEEVKSRTHPSRCRKIISCIYFVCHLPLVFLSPTSPICLFRLPFSVCLFLLAFCSLVFHVPSICLHLRLLKI